MNPSTAASFARKTTLDRIALSHELDLVHDEGSRRNGIPRWRFKCIHKCWFLQFRRQIENLLPYLVNRHAKPALPLYLPQQKISPKFYYLFFYNLNHLFGVSSRFLGLQKKIEKGGSWKLGLCFMKITCFTTIFLLSLRITMMKLLLIS